MMDQNYHNLIIVGKLLIDLPNYYYLIILHQWMCHGINNFYILIYQIEYNRIFLMKDYLCKW